MKTINTIAFDLGGVLIELGDVQEMLPEFNDSTFWARWLSSTSIREFESGQVDPDTFAENAVAEFALTASPSEFLAVYTSWPKGLFDGALDLLRQLSPDYQLVCLSNTNEIHWERFSRETDLLEHFHVNLPSHITGHMKPDTAVYKHLINTLGVDPASILFLDDNDLNVQAAKDAGIEADLTRKPGGAKSNLIRRGLLNPL